MGQNKGEQSAELPKRTLAFMIPANMTTTANAVRFTAQTGMTPLEVRCTPLTEFDFTTGNETYVLSMTDDGTEIATSSATTIAAGNKTATLKAPATSQSTHIAKDSVMVILMTTSGTTPITPAGSLIEFDYIEG
jgi:hypothetical protein